MANELMAAREEFKRRVEQLEKTFAEIDAQFQKWKEGVLSFEHGKFGPDDDFDGDNWVCDRESVWASEDENDIQQSSEQANGKSEDGCGISEKGGQRNE